MSINTSIPVIDKIIPENIETATFALGWFWGPDARFGLTEGVIRTRVGYAGGTKDNPTYHSLGDHTETIQINYDPTKISYEELLDIFWSMHNPKIPTYSRQYMSIIFFHNKEQEKLAMKTRTQEIERENSEVYTEIIPYSKFYLAETYHQKYYMQLVQDFKKEFRTIYPKAKDFMNSTAAAHINGYIKGYGKMKLLKNELNDLGLSASSCKRLLDIVDGYGR